MDELIGTRELFLLAERDPTFTTRYDPASWVTVAEGSFAIVGSIHCTDLDRVVAVKLIRFRIPPEIREKVRGEVANAHAVKSPYVLHAFSPFFRGELAWIEMPFVRGRTLTELLERQRLPFAAARTLALNLLDALRAAHSVDVVHRDIKPANLLVPDDPPLRLLVLDFGISRAGDAARMTATGFPGTPQYASPEAWKGKPVGPSGDIYSASNVLYQLFTGQRPWPIGDDLSPEQLCQLHLRRLGPPRRPREIAEDIPRVLDDVLFRGISLEPDKRPSADELYGQIAALGDGETATVAAQPAAAAPSPKGDAPSGGRRRLLVLGAGALGLVVVSLGSMMLSRMSVRPSTELNTPSALSAFSVRAVDPWTLVVRNDSGRDATALRADVKDALAQSHYVSIDALAAGEERRIERAEWSPPLDRPLPSNLDVRANVTGVVEQAALAISSPTPVPTPEEHALPQRLGARSEDRRSLEVTNGSEHAIDILRLTVVDADGVAHEIVERELEGGMSTVLWPEKWSPPLKGSLPRELRIVATVRGQRCVGTLPISSK